MENLKKEYIKRVLKLKKLDRIYCRIFNYKISSLDNWRNKIKSPSFIDSISDSQMELFVKTFDFMLEKETKSYKIKQKKEKIRVRKKKNKKKKKVKISKHKQKYYDYLNSKEWADIRLDMYEIKGNKCERCGNKQQLEIHHISYKNIFNEEPEDLELLCRSCHQKEHGII